MKLTVILGLVGCAVGFWILQDVAPDLSQLSGKDLNRLEQEQKAAQVTRIFEEVAPLTPPQEVQTCMDLDHPGVMVGRFCRRFEAQSVNLRTTKDIPVAALRQLPNMTQIEASGARWASLTPLLEFPNLTVLDLRYSTFQDFSALGSFSNLQALSLSKSNFTEVALISDLLNLQVLDLADLPIRDLSALGNMPKLREVYLSGTQVSDLSPLLGLENLRILDVRDTAVVDLGVFEARDGLTIYQ
ncbi:leucine-rich repeat domain-containing protein [Algirhabdus cladophorae]|uniref:leucine-rich repeat domain-containing protein n=1 Tax=Algirhabdus cladophorae TaxID=3377108 RepID=UPI003B84B149